VESEYNFCRQRKLSFGHATIKAVARLAVVARLQRQRQYSLLGQTIRQLHYFDFIAPQQDCNSTIIIPMMALHW